MPKKQQYLQVFNIFIGLELVMYKLSNIEIDHVAIKKYDEYYYPTELTFISNDDVNEKDVDELLFFFDEYVKGERIVQTYSGNIYVCEFIYYDERTDILQTKNCKKVIIKCTGSAKKE